MDIATITSPADFTTLASSWLAAITVVSGTLFVLVYQTIVRIHQLQDLIASNQKNIGTLATTVDSHAKALNGALGGDIVANEHV